MEKLNNESIREKIKNKDFENIKDWDVINVTDVSNLFYNMINFNFDISNLDVSNVINMSCMFEECDNFNQDIGNWNVSKWDLSDIFFQCSIFDIFKKN